MLILLIIQGVRIQQITIWFKCLQLLMRWYYQPKHMVCWRVEKDFCVTLPYEISATECKSSSLLKQTGVLSMICLPYQLCKWYLRNIWSIICLDMRMPAIPLVNCCVQEKILLFIKLMHISEEIHIQVLWPLLIIWNVEKEKHLKIEEIIWFWCLVKWKLILKIKL